MGEILFKNSIGSRGGSKVFFKLKLEVFVMTKAVSNRDNCFISIIIVRRRALLTKFCVAYIFPPPTPQYY